MAIGNKIKEYRLNQQLTQEELGKILNVSRSTISSWEVGRNYPDVETLIEISYLFHITVDSLLREDNKMLSAINFNKAYKRKLKLGIFILSGIVMFLVFFITVNHLRQPVISFEKEVITADLEMEPFLREEIKAISIKDNIVTVTFQSSLESTYYGYFADGGGGDAMLNLYKKKVADDDSLKYDRTTQIDLSSMPKIKHLTVFIKEN